MLSWSGRFFCICILTGILNCLSSSSYASFDVRQADPHNTWFLGVGIGTSRINLDSSTTVANGSNAPPPWNNDLFTINSPTTNIIQLLLGYRWFYNHTFFPYTQVQLQYRHFNKTHISGSVTQYSIPEFKNYNYKMSYNAELFALAVKFNLVALTDRLLPYIAGGFGGILNHVNDYNEAALSSVTPRTSPAYAGNTNKNFIFTLGAGIDFILTPNYWLTLGYERIFQDSINSNPGATTWSGTQLNFGNANIDTVFVNLSVNVPDGLRI